MPSDCNGVLSGEICEDGVDVWFQLLWYYRAEGGAGFTIPGRDLDAMMCEDSEHIRRLEERLKLKCRRVPFNVLGPTIVREETTLPGFRSPVSPGWYLGSHQRKYSGWLDCCSRRGQICLEVSDTWDYDENDPLPPLFQEPGGFCKALGSKLLGLILQIGDLGLRTTPVPVTGKKCVDLK